MRTRARPASACNFCAERRDKAQSMKHSCTGHSRHHDASPAGRRLGSHIVQSVREGIERPLACAHAVTLIALHVLVSLRDT